MYASPDRAGSQEAVGKSSIGTCSPGSLMRWRPSSKKERQDSETDQVAEQKKEFGQNARCLRENESENGGGNF